MKLTRWRTLAANAAAILFLCVSAGAPVWADATTAPAEPDFSLADRALKLVQAATAPATRPVAPATEPTTAPAAPAESADVPPPVAMPPTTAPLTLPTTLPMVDKDPATMPTDTQPAETQPAAEAPATPAVAMTQPTVEPPAATQEAVAEAPTIKPMAATAPASVAEVMSDTRPATAPATKPVAAKPAVAPKSTAAKPVETAAAEPAKTDEAKPAANPGMSTIQRLWYAQGHTHPIIVHFPIGLLFAGALAAALRPFARKVTANVVYFCLLVGAAGAVLSSLAGWAWAPQLKPGWDAWAGQVVVSPMLKLVGAGMLAAGIVGVGLLAMLGGRQWMRNRPRLRSSWLQVSAFVGTVGLAAAVLGIAGESRADVMVIGVAGEYSPFFLHRWSGILMTVCSVAVLIWATLALRRAGAVQWPWQAAVVLLAMGMGWVGHEGGELVYPENADKIFGIAVDTRKVKLERESVNAPPRPKIEVVAATAPAGDGSISFAKQVDPIFTAKCYYCHNADEKKGGFRMHTETAALEGGDGDEPLYVAGDSGKSVIFKHIVEGEHNEDYSLMPPKKEKKPVTPEEVEILKKWVDQGAKWDN